MMRVALIDDEPLARLAVRTRLVQRGAYEIVGEFGDGDSAAAGLAALSPDLVFVDVDMPGRSGIEVLAALPRSTRPMAILLTAHDHFALQAFALDALDYLLKPVDDERFDEALGRAGRAFPYRRGGASPAPAAAAAPPAYRRSFSVRTGTRLLVLAAADVERIEAEGDYAALHANGKTYLLREPLQVLAAQLDPGRFQRVHRSAIVRLDMVSELRTLTNRDSLLRLRDGTLLRASRTYMPALLDALARHPPTAN